MPLNIADAEDAYLGAQAQFDEFIEEFESQWYEPLGEALIAALMQSIPPEVKEFIDPEVLKTIEDRLGGV